MKRKAALEVTVAIVRNGEMAGRPHVAGTTADVEFILVSLRDGVTPEFLYRETGLTEPGIRAAVAYALAHRIRPEILKEAALQVWRTPADT